MKNGCDERRGGGAPGLPVMLVLLGDGFAYELYDVW